MVNDIEDWIAEKNIEARVVSQDELPWVIAEHIVRKGTRAQPFLRPAWLKNREKIKTRMRRAVKRGVQRA